MAHIPNEVKPGQPVFREEIYDFSLVLGDPVFRFFRKARLSGDHLELLHRRLIIITSIAWCRCCSSIFWARTQPA